MQGRLVSPVMVGRDAEIAIAIDRLDEAMLGRPSQLLIAGEAGVGKSRLVGELTGLARDRGCLVLVGGCVDVGDAGLPYGPIAQALRALPRELAALDLAELVGPFLRDLAPIVPGLDPSAEPRGPESGTLEQARTFEAVLGLLRRLASRQPVVLVVEDLHWADATTRAVIGFLTRNLDVDRVLLVLTYRSDELHRRHPLRAWLVEQERSARTVRIEVRRLDRDMTRRLVAAILDVEPDAVLVDRLQRRSDGNPFFLEELLRIDRSEPSTGRLPETLRELLLARFTALPEPAQAVLGVMAVAGRPVDHDLLGAVAELPDDVLLDALREAVGRHLAIVQGDSDGDSYAFRHALVQEAVYEDLLPGERQRLHRAFAGQIEATSDDPASRDAGRLAEVAYHWWAARAHEPAFVASIRAGDAAAAAFAFAEAVKQYERALELWDTVATPEERTGVDRVELLERAGQAAEMAADYRRSLTLRRDAVLRAAGLSDPRRSAIAGERLARALWHYGDSAAALAAYETTTASLPADEVTPERARVLAGHAQMLMLMGHYRRSESLAQQAIEVAARVGATAIEGHARNTLGADLGGLGECDEGIANSERALAIARELRISDDVGRAYVNFVDVLRFCNQLERAARLVDEGLEVGQAMGIGRTYGLPLRFNGVLVNYDLGRWETAAALADEAFRDPQEGRTSEVYGLSSSLPLIVGLGDDVTAKAMLDRGHELLGQFPTEIHFDGPYYTAAAEFALWHRRPAEALDAVAVGFERLTRTDDRFFPARLIRLGLWAAADLAEVARARRDRETEAASLRRGQELEGQLERLLGEIAVSAADDLRLAEASTARAEGTRLRGSSDPEAWRAAAAEWQGQGRPYPVGYARFREAEAWLALGDRAAADRALAEAHRIAAELGARPLAQAVESLARRSRIELRTPAEADRTAAPAPVEPFGLTERERQILALVAAGRTNRQIGEALFITGNTAGVHVSNILGKLGVAGRAEAAAIAVRLGLDEP